MSDVPTNARTDAAATAAHAQQQFMELVAGIRPELHRYCTRMTGSVFDGEDVLQDALAKAWFALAQMDSPPPLRPWLFRIAHNTAMDFLRRYEHQHVDSGVDIERLADEANAQSDATDVSGTLTDLALSILTSLPPVQRSALILKDVVGLSLDETAVTMGTTIGAVKAALVRARSNVVRARGQYASDAVLPAAVDADTASRLRRYADLFNARDWNALRTFFDDETRLELVSYRQLVGPPAAQYFTRYEQSVAREESRLEFGHVNGEPVLALFRQPALATPAYFIRLDWRDGYIGQVRDYRQVPYIAHEAVFVASATRALEPHA